MIHVQFNSTRIPATPPKDLHSKLPHNHSLTTTLRNLVVVVRVVTAAQVPGASGGGGGGGEMW